MTQSHSTFVHASSSGSACPVRAGTAPSLGVLEDRPDQPASPALEQVRALLADERALEPDYYLNTLPSQREELARAAQQTLLAEVVLLRTAMKRFYQAVNHAEAPDVIDNLAKELNLLGLTCSRLGNVIRLNQALQGSGQDEWAKGINAAMQDLLAEWDQQQGGSRE